MRTDAFAMRSLGWRPGLGAAALLGAAAAAATIAPNGRLADGILALAAAGTAGAVVIGLRRHRPQQRALWLLLAAAFASWALASLWLLVAGRGATGPFDASQLVLLPGYILVAIAVGRLMGALGTSVVSAVDAGIGTLAVGSLLWTFALGPNFDSGHLSAVAFVVIDMALLTALLRLALTPTGAVPAARLMLGAFAVMLATDIASLSPHIGGRASERAVFFAIVAADILTVAGALHPSMTRIPVREAGVPRASPKRLSIVVSSAMFAPAAGLAVNELVEKRADIWGFVGMGGALVVLVLVRLTLVVRQEDELRRRAELSEQKFRMVFESAGLGISIGRDGLMTETNPAYQQMLGYDAAELASMHYTDISHPDDVHLDIENAAKVAAGELRRYSFEKRVVRKDGTPIWVGVTVSLAADGSFGISLVEDITARKKLEDELRQSQKMEAVGQLAGGVAHDFNNLMTAVLGYADILRRELPPSDPMREAVDVIADSAVRAGELTRRLLAFSRRQVLQLEPTELGAVVSRFLPILQRVLPENIRLDADLDAGIVARVDPAQLEQVLLNLVVNARDALPEGGHIAVAVHANGAAELVVSDDGTGMDESTREHIFEPFFTTKPKNAGTGLGLAMVDGIVAQIGGTIDVESAPGCGSTFRIRLPLSSADVPPRPSPRGDAPRGHGRVLLTEDEDVVRRVTVHLLDAAGYDVVAAASGEEALTLLEAGERIDVLVTDLVMTGMNGQELVRRVRELVPDLPVLFISGYAEDVLGEGLGGDVLLTKPFSPTQLAGAIERVRSAVPVT